MVTLSGPVVAPSGTVASIAVSEVTVKLALTPLKATAVAPGKFVPLNSVMVGLVPPAVSPPTQDSDGGGGK